LPILSFPDLKGAQPQAPLGAHSALTGLRAPPHLIWLSGASINFNKAARPSFPVFHGIYVLLQMGFSGSPRIHILEAFWGVASPHSSRLPQVSPAFNRFFLDCLSGSPSRRRKYYMDPPRIIQRWIHSSWDLPRLVSIQLKYSGSIQRGILSRHSALSNSGAIPLRIGLLEIIPYEAYPTRDSSYRSPTLDPINSGSISHASTTLPHGLPRFNHTLRRTLLSFTHCKLTSPIIHCQLTSQSCLAANPTPISEQTTMLFVEMERA
jgi:hypothetical protein